MTIRIAAVSSGLVRVPPIRGGAVEEYVYQLVRHLRMLGVDAVIVDSSWSGQSEYEEVNGAPIIRIPIPELRDVPKRKILREYLFGLKVSKIFRKLDVNIIHANTAWAGFALTLKVKDVPIVYTCHNPLWPEERVHASEHLVRLVESYTMSKSKAVIALNKTMMKSIVRKARIDSRKTFIVPNGVNTEFFKPGIKAGDVIKRYRLKKKKVILFVGRVTYVKGVHLLLKAFKELVSKYRDLKLVIVGPLTDHFDNTEPSPYAKTLIEYAKRVLPKDSYTFTGPIDRESLRKLYSVAYVCVLPSYAEAFPMVILEAMSSGCPVIGSNAGGIVNAIEDGITGFIFKKGDYKDLKEKLKMLVENETFRKTLSTNCRRIVEEKYDWRVVATKLREIYEDIIY